MAPRAAPGVRISMFGIMEDMLRLRYPKEKGCVVGTTAWRYRVPSSGGEGGASAPDDSLDSFVRS